MYWLTYSRTASSPLKPLAGFQNVMRRGACADGQEKSVRVSCWACLRQSSPGVAENVDGVSGARRNERQTQHLAHQLR